MTEIIQPIPARLKNVAPGGYVAGAEDIIDDELGKPQSQVNQETNKRVSALENKVGPGGSVDERIAVETQRAQDAEGLLQSEINALDSQNYVTVSDYASLPATGSADTIYRVSSWDGNANSGAGAVDATKYSEYAWNAAGSEYKLLDVKTQIGEVFDISEYHASGGTLAKYADLTAALGTNGANVPEGIRRGGMSVKYVQTSDNKYVQYRLMATSFSTDTTQWQGVVIESNPESKSLIESRGVFKNIHDNTRKFFASEVVEPLNFVENSIIHYDSEFEGSDNNLTGNIIPGVNSVYVVPVDPTKKYYINRITKYYYDICLYDEDMIFISTLYTYNQSIGQSSAWDKAVRIPSNCRYFAFERNYSVEPYVGYESNYSAWQNDGSWINKAQNQINVIEDEKNVMFRYINVVDGAKRYDNVTFENANQSTVNGVIIPGDKTIYILEVNSSISYYINRITTIYYNIVLYNNNKEFISTLFDYETSIGHSRGFDESKQIPTTCHFIGFIADYNNVSPFVGKEEDYQKFTDGKKYIQGASIVIPELSSVKNDIKDIQDEKEAMFPYINLVDGAKRYDNVTFENANQSTVNGVIISGDKTIYICEIDSSMSYYINQITLYYYNIVLYDNSMEFISTLFAYEQQIGKRSVFYANKQFPANCKYVGFIADYTEVQPYIGKESEYNSWQNGIKYKESSSIILPFKHVDVFLPSDIYVANGRTIELYNNQVCLQADKVHIQWICSVGLALERKFSITAISDTVGNNYPLTINVFDDDFNLLATKTITIHIVNNVIQSAKKIVNIGDSLSYSDKSQFSEMRLLSNQLLEFVGTKAYTATASDNALYAGKIDGRPGFTTSYFLEGRGSSYFKEEHNTFWDGSKFNFSYYVANTLNNVAPDAVFIWLGTNEMNNLTTFLTNMQTIVDSIREYSNTIKIFIVNTIYRSNQNGIGRQGAVEGYNPSNGVFKYKEDYKVMEMMKNLYEQFNGESNIYVVPLALQMDSEYNYGQQEMDVNPRNTYKTIYPVDSIHPRKPGQLQMADVFFSMLCGLL